MSPTEDMLRRSLRARADLVQYQPTSVLDVARRARAARRRRAGTTVLIAAAAVAAVGVPAGLVQGSRAPGPSAAPAGPTVTVGSLSELPAGTPPTVDYMLGRTYVFADGGEVELDVDPGRVLDAAPYPGGVLVAQASSTTVAKQLWFDRDGRLEQVGCGGGELVLSGDGKRFAYARTVRGCDSWGRTSVLQWGYTDTMLGDPLHLETLSGQRIEPVGVSADRIVYNAIGTPGSDLPGRVYAIGKDGVPATVGGVVRATAWDPIARRVAGCPAEGRCVVVGERDGAVQLTLDPGEEPLSFSPDGRYLATADVDGERLTTVKVRDARTGDVVVALSGDEAVLHGEESVTWEASDRLLVGLVEADGEALVRLGVDGSTARATTVTEPTIHGYLLPGP